MPFFFFSVLNLDESSFFDLLLDLFNVVGLIEMVIGSIGFLFTKLELLEWFVKLFCCWLLMRFVLEVIFSMTTR